MMNSDRTFDDELESLNLERIRTAIEDDGRYLNGDHRNRTQVPLIYAAEIGHKDLLLLLLSLGADVDACDTRNRTTLHAAAIHGYPEITELLLDRGANPEMKDIFNHTPLMWATAGGDIANRLATATVLLERGAKLDLNSVVRLGDVNSLQKILEADPEAIHHAPLPTRLLIDAIDLNSIEIVRLLLQHGVDPNTPPEKGSLPIFHAVSRTHKDPVFLLTLLEWGASPHVRDAQGNSLLERAEGVGSKELSQIIRQHRG